MFKSLDINAGMALLEFVRIFNGTGDHRFHSICGLLYLILIKLLPHTSGISCNFRLHPSQTFLGLKIVHDLLGLDWPFPHLGHSLLKKLLS